MICAGSRLRSALPEFRRQRYASFDKGKGKAFEDGRLSLADLRDHAAAVEPEQVSGRQEWLENLVNDGMALAFMKQRS